MANVFMCHLEEKLTSDDLMPHLYRRYVDDTLTRMPNTDAAAMFLTTLNGLHPSLSFTIKLPVDDRTPFIVMISSRMEQNLKRKSRESESMLACSYISIVKLTNAIRTLYKDNIRSRLCAIFHNRGS